MAEDPAVRRVKETGERLLEALKEEARLAGLCSHDAVAQDLFERWKECRRRSKLLELDYAEAVIRLEAARNRSHPALDPGSAGELA